MEAFAERWALPVVAFAIGLTVAAFVGDTFSAFSPLIALCGLTARDKRDGTTAAD